MPRSLHSAKPIEACPYCADSAIIKKGKRRNKFGAVQLFYCTRCQKKFTPILSKHNTFPLRLILEALCLYNRLYTLTEAAQTVSKKYGLAVSPQNIRNWRDDFGEYLPVSAPAPPNRCALPGHAAAPRRRGAATPWPGL